LASSVLLTGVKVVFKPSIYVFILLFDVPIKDCESKHCHSYQHSTSPTISNQDGGDS